MRPSTYRGYDLVVSCEQFLAKGPMEEYNGVVVHCPMRDADDFYIDERMIMSAAFAAVAAYNRGGRVLVHCTGGLNRSSVVTARTLQLMGYTAAEAVLMLRTNHDAMCLCNRSFERWVLGEQLPTAETSIFREETDGQSDG